MAESSTTKGNSEEILTERNSQETTESLFVCATRPEKPPVFYKEDPTLWFSIVENALAYAGVTRDQMKFQYVVSYADPIIIPLIADLIKNPPATNKYNAIKERIISAFAEPTSTRLNRLFKGLTLGDKKPSHYLQELKDLADKHCDNEVLKSLLLGQLDTSTRIALLASGEDDVEKLALLADKIQASQTSTLSNIQQLPYLNAEVLSEEITQLKKKVEELCALSRRDKQTDRDPESFTVGSKQQNTRFVRTYKLCYYHFKFGKRARKCVQPCNWSTQFRDSEN